MRGSLGEKIGEGSSSDVYVWAPGRIVKLFKAGMHRRVPWWEARMTRAVRAAGAPASEVFDEVTVDGRFGIVLQHLPGPTLLQLTRSGGVTVEQAGAILARLALAVHRTPPPRDVLPLRDCTAGSMRLDGDALPKHVASGVLALIDRLSPAAGLCHGDLHAGNVIMTAEGPRLVDWVATARAPAALDLGVSHILLSEMAPYIVEDPNRPHALIIAMQAEYAQLTGVSAAALVAALEAWLPVVYVRGLLGGAWHAARERMIQRIEEALRREGLTRGALWAAAWTAWSRRHRPSAGLVLEPSLRSG